MNPYYTLLAVHIQKEKLLKSRLVYSGIIVLIVVMGICSRKFSAYLPDFIAQHSGDALWAAMIYLGVRVWQINKSVMFAFVASVLFCYAIECSQLYQAAWIIQVRQTTIGALVLGHSFLAVDLLRYIVGITLTLIIEKYIIKQNR